VSLRSVRIEFGRIFVFTDEAERAAQVISGVFGVASTSPVRVIHATLEDILETGVKMARESFRPGRSFAVGARRMGEHEFSSQDIREQLGARILSDLADLDLRVDLKTPEQRIYVEVRDDKAYLFTESYPGVGGMPTGTQGELVCIISGSLSSAVAAFRVMKRGCTPVFLVILGREVLDRERAEQPFALMVARRLARFVHGQSVPTYVVPASRLLPKTGSDVTRARCVLWRRATVRLAAAIAKRHDADGIVIGDVVGETCHQSLGVIRLLSADTGGLPLFTPCFGDDLDDLRTVPVGLDDPSGLLVTECLIQCECEDLALESVASEELVCCIDPDSLLSDIERMEL